MERENALLSKYLCPGGGFCTALSKQAKQTYKAFGGEGFWGTISSVAILRSKREHHDALFEQVATLSVMKPVYLLECRPDREAVLLSHSLLQP